MIIESLKKSLQVIEDAIIYMEETDTAWYSEYSMLRKQKRVIEKTIKKLERLEVRGR